MLPSTERADARRNHLLLLAAAVEVFAEAGIEADMRGIAERAGLSVGALYKHFPGKKDQLIAAVMERAVEEFEHAFGSADALPDPVAGLRTFLGEGLRVVERYGEVMTAVFTRYAPSARQTIITRFQRSALHERLIELIARGVRSGAFRQDLDPEVAAALLRGVLAPWSLAELRRQRSPDELAETVVSLFRAAASGSSGAG